MFSATGVHTKPPCQAAGQTSQASPGHEVQGKQKIYSLFPWLGQTQGSQGFQGYITYHLLNCTCV